MMRRIAALLVVLTFISLASSARAQVRGFISGPGATAYPIAIAPPSGTPPSSGAAQKFIRTLERNLELSGLFRVSTDGPLMGGSAESIDFASWKSMGARLVVVTRYLVEPSNVQLEARLFDVAEERQLGGKRYTGDEGDVPRMANRFADEILLLVTGERGPFDTRIAFVSTRAGRFKELFVTGFDGSDIRQLTRNQSINLSPSWTPDGRSILFTSYMERRPQLFEIGVDGGQPRRVLGGPGIVVGGRAAPTGDAIAVSREEKRGNTEIVVVNHSGETLRVISRDDNIDVSPTWSPDGRQLAFCSSRAGTPQIYVADIGGGQGRRVTFEGNYNTSPSWSPKGDKIAYTGRVGSRFQIFVVDLASGAVQQVTSSSGDNVDPSWSPDGRYLLFASTRSGRSAIYMSDWRGIHQNRLIVGADGDTSPAWSSWLE